jgi:hypothetical protein
LLDLHILQFRSLAAIGMTDAGSQGSTLYVLLLAEGPLQPGVRISIFYVDEDGLAGFGTCDFVIYQEQLSEIDFLLPPK